MGSKQLPWLVTFFFVKIVPAIVDSCDKVLGNFFANYSAGSFSFFEVIMGAIKGKRSL